MFRAKVTLSSCEFNECSAHFFDKAMQAKLGVDELFFSALNARDWDPPNFLPTVNSNNEVTADQGYTPQNEKWVK